MTIYCNNVASISSLSKVVRRVVATNVALKIVCRRHVTRIDFLCNNVALKIVVKNRPVYGITLTFSQLTIMIMREAM